MSTWPPPQRARAYVSQLPYTPGLDGLRALAVVAVMVYHADHAWLTGGFLGVEVFFVISGYLITLLMIGEHERIGKVQLGQFWKRRFRRLLPALFVMMGALALYLAIAYRRPQGRTRGDFLAGVFYGGNWYQIVVGQSYTAAEAFAPLRHLWSLAVEEQFYLVWPLVMVLILRKGRERLPRVGLWLATLSIAIAVATALLFVSGDVADECGSEAVPHGYATMFGRCININDALYLSTFTRAGGLMLGAALAMLWRPGALMRGPLRTKHHALDVVGLVGLVGLGLMIFKLSISESGESLGSRYDPWLFRGGLFLTGFATVMVIAATVHRRSLIGRALGNPLFRWIGTRSYGLYLYHWPIYQIIRKFAGVPLTMSQFLVAMAITAPVTEISYRVIETPIRLGRLGRWLRGEQRIRTGTARRVKRRAVILVASMSAAVGFAGVSLAVARNVCVGDVECSIEQAEASAAAAAAAQANGPVVAPVASTLPDRGSTTTPGTVADTTADTTAGTTADSSAGTADGGGAETTAPPAPPGGQPETTAPATTTPPTTIAAAPATPADPNASTPAETTPPTPATIPGTSTIQPIALGESVMLGAITNLQAGGFFVDAAKSRQGADMAALIESMRAGNLIGDTVVIQIGTNGAVEWTDFERMMAQLSPAQTPHVVFLTVRVPKKWEAANNLMIQSLPDHYPNVTVVDWNFASMGTSLCADDVHIACGGGAAQYYTNLIFDAIERPDLKR